MKKVSKALSDPSLILSSEKYSRGLCRTLPGVQCRELVSFFNSFSYSNGYSLCAASASFDWCSVIEDGNSSCPARGKFLFVFDKMDLFQKNQQLFYPL